MLYMQHYIGIWNCSFFD